MHIWILWTVLSIAHGQRNYVRSFASRDACEHLASVMNTIADRQYDWVCLPAVPYNKP